MAKVIIQSTEVKNISGTSNKTGKPYSIRKQAAWIQLSGKPFPVEIELRLPDDTACYAPGEYETDIESALFVDKFRSLSVGDYLDLKLIRGTALKAAVSA